MWKSFEERPVAGIVVARRKPLIVEVLGDARVMVVPAWLDRFLRYPQGRQAMIVQSTDVFRCCPGHECPRHIRMAAGSPVTGKAVNDACLVRQDRTNSDLVSPEKRVSGVDDDLLALGSLRRESSGHRFADELRGQNLALEAEPVPRSRLRFSEQTGRDHHCRLGRPLGAFDAFDLPRRLTTAARVPRLGIDDDLDTRVRQIIRHEHTEGGWYDHLARPDPLQRAPDDLGIDERDGPGLVANELFAAEIFGVPKLISNVFSGLEQRLFKPAADHDAKPVVLEKGDWIHDRFGDLVPHLGAPDRIVVQQIRCHGRGILTGRPRCAIACLASRTENMPKWKTDAASAACAPPSDGSTASARCRGCPAPPDAMTGTGTASVTAR